VVRGYRLTLEADDDLDRIEQHYLDEAGARVALHVIGEITKAFQFLSEMPGAGHARSDLTSEPVKFWSVFSYLIVYDPATKPLGIARVVHGSQDLERMFREKPPRA